MTAAATAFGWRAAGLAAATAGGASLAALWWKRAELSGEVSGDSAQRKKKAAVGLGHLLQLRLTWFAFTFFFFSTLGFGALQNFAPSLLRDLYGDEGIEQMRAVKRAIDPDWKMAPGVLFPR